MSEISLSQSNKQQMSKTTFSLRKLPVTVGNSSVKARQERVALATIWIPFIGTIVAVGTATIWGIGPVEVGLLVSMYVLTSLGIEFGFHRNLAHKAFETSPFIRNLFAILGSMAAEGSVLYWVATHRRHHVHSDTVDDPHSPYVRTIDRKEESLGLLRGLWHSHVSWMITDDITNCTLFAKDLAKNPTLSKISELYFPIVIAGLVIPAIIGGVLEGSWIGIVNGFLWGGLVRIFLVHHSTWSNSSFAHKYGTRPFNTGDLSANNLWVAIPTFGASWQNNHHAFPNAAYLGLKWWQIDVAAWVIYAFAIFGLVWDVKQVTPQMIKEKSKIV
jgi:stearoyl-CoA desaturase (Delta-9 desaturase)